METEETTTVTEETSIFDHPAFQYVVAPLAVYGCWKLGGKVAAKLRDRRAPKATVIDIQPNES